ncbi:hypothetical protein Agabi119p4_7912 [Agaricus bisporus var. burnettii]|uniref:Uncharacterized protein n=1 Tax=Agaricus bisporus var. burnettii TaxID=192524 RepID=A0A8H7C7V1_AGABI|nr:hypothetical protein Agabi119p4_7912 [Agaricus bisporus var. burnettii]
MELDSQSSTPSSPSLSDLDEFYSAPSSPLVPGLDAPYSLPQWSFRSPTNTITSNSSSLSPSTSHAPPPLIEGDEGVSKHPHQIDLDNSLFSKMENAIINDLQMRFFFHVDEAFPFNTNQIWSPFCQAKYLVINNPSVGNLIYYDTDLGSSPPMPPPQSKSVEHALFTGIKNAVLNNVDMVYTAKNSSESNPDYEYEQIKIVAPFYKSKNIVLNNPIIQLITVIKDGGKRHRCPPEKISSPDIIFAPFYGAKHSVINDGAFFSTHETQALFNCT